MKDLNDETYSQAVEFALRGFMANMDYDIHKSIECNEDDGSDSYPAHAVKFIEDMDYFLSK